MIGQDMLADLTLPMPGWWPLIKPQAPPPPGMTYVYVLFPVVAALGYGDIAITGIPAPSASHGRAAVRLQRGADGAALAGNGGSARRAAGPDHGFRGHSGRGVAVAGRCCLPLGTELVIYWGAGGRKGPAVLMRPGSPWCWA